MTAGVKEFAGEFADGFAEAILDARKPAPDGVIDPQGRAAGKRFDVYRNNVIFSLIEAMRTAFPVIHKLLGERFFTSVARAYVRAHPPKSPLLMFYGSDFSEFLEGFEPVADLPYLPDIARLELAMRISYHARDAAPISGEALQEIPPEALASARFDFAPAALTLESPYPVGNIWHANMEADSDAKKGKKEIGKDGVSLLIFRPEWDVMFRELTQGQYDFIQALCADETLESAADTAQKSEPDFDLAGALRLLLESRVLCGIKTET